MAKHAKKEITGNEADGNENNNNNKNVVQADVDIEYTCQFVSFTCSFFSGSSAISLEILFSFRFTSFSHSSVGSQWISIIESYRAD